MKYDIYDSQLEALTAQISELEKELRYQNDTLAWYKTFDESKVNCQLIECRNKKTIAESKRNEIKLEKPHKQSSVKILEGTAALGWDPRYWLSLNRRTSKKELKEERRKLKFLVDQDEKLASTIIVHGALCSFFEEQLRRYQMFDSSAIQVNINKKSLELEKIKSEVSYVTAKKTSLNQKLEPVLKDLHSYEVKKSELEREISIAQNFEYRLLNSSDKQAIHDECFQKFGQRSPRSVMSDRMKHLESTNRLILKIQERLESILRRSKHSIKCLVIDGSNLCFDGKEFIGFSALRPMIRGLADKYSVVVVFDASIRRRVGMKDNEIRTDLSGIAKIHVVASKQKADETLLDVASSAESYVISNDRFLEYSDKSAVHERRLIRHEILNGTIIIPDLEFKCRFQA